MTPRRSSWLAVLPLLLVPLCAGANEEEIAPWRSVSLVVELPQPYGTTTIAVVSAPDADKTLRVTGVQVTCEGNRTITIPAAAFSDLTAPQLGLLQITHGPDYNGKLGVYVKIPFGPYHPNTRLPHARGIIAIEDFKALYRATETPTEGNQTTWEKRDL